MSGGLSQRTKVGTAIPGDAEEASTEKRAVFLWYQNLHCRWHAKANTEEQLRVSSASAAASSLLLAQTIVKTYEELDAVDMVVDQQESSRPAQADTIAPCQCWGLGRTDTLDSLGAANSSEKRKKMSDSGHRSLI